MSPLVFFSQKAFPVFSKKSKIDSFAELAQEVREYADLRLRYLRVDLTQRLAQLFAGLAIALVVLLVLALALVFVAGSVALFLAPYVGGLSAACLIVALLCLLLAYAAYRLRRPLLLRPITIFVAHILLDDHNGETEDGEGGKEADV